ncbi:MAG: hypothetical protein ACK5KP_12365, partial [Paludibacteraceae bacterium]
MKKITFLIATLLVTTLSFGQVVMEPLWEFSSQNGNLANTDDVKNGFAISPDGSSLYLSTRMADADQVALYDATTGTRTGYLPALTGFASNYGGDVAVDGNGAIYASNVIISGTGALKVAKWDNETATPTLFISTTAHGGSGTNRIGYGMDVRIDATGNGYILMHKNGTADFLIWPIVANTPTSQDPVIVTASGATITDSYARISIVDDTHFWVDGNARLPVLCTLTLSEEEPPLISAERIVTRSDVNVGVGGATEFSLNGKRYGVLAVNNHTTTAAYQPKHHALVQEMAVTGVNFTGPVLDKFPDLGLGGTTDYSHFVEILTHVSGTVAHVYLMGGANGIAAFKAEPAKIFTVTVPAGTEHVYIAGDFTGKSWDHVTPFELTATSNTNEFSGLFPCADGVEYKYLNGVNNWAYVEATAPNTELSGNRTYNASDNVPYWKAVSKVKFNVSFDAGYSGTIPSQLYVKGDWDSWATGIALTASSTPLTAPGLQRAPSATNAVSFTGSYGNGTTDVIYSNTEYKFYTNEPSADNWEDRGSNRWAIYPLIDDVITNFIANIPTGLNQQKEVEVRVMRTPTGIAVTFDGEADIELYGINGTLIEKTRVANNYSRDLGTGTYIIRVNGQ